MPRFQCNLPTQTRSKCTQRGELYLKASDPPLGLKVRIKCHDDSQDLKILSRRKPNYSWRQLVAAEEATPRPTRVIDSVLQPYDGGSLAIRNAIFECCRIGFRCLVESRQADVAVPVNFGAHCCAPAFAEGLVQWQLGEHPKSARIPGRCDFLSPNVIFECGRNPFGLPFGSAVPQEPPEFEPGIRLCRTEQNSFF